MRTLYPFAVITASRPDDARLEHGALIAPMVTRVSQGIFDQLPFLNDKTFGRRATAYAGILGQLLAHVPADEIDSVELDLVTTARELLMVDSDQPPPAFDLVCATGYHVAFPGTLSLAKIDRRFRGYRCKRGVHSAEEVNCAAETVAQRAERWMIWVEAGRPDDRNPAILKYEAGPEESFVEQYMQSLPKNLKDEARWRKAHEVINYLRDGQRLLLVRKIRWNRKNGGSQ